MNIRESTESWEAETLSPYASLSRNSKGRDREEEPCDIRPVYQRDRDRIIHCKAFRRLKHKTQVFLAPEGDHYRTRLTHTLEVAQIARTIARALRMNEDLTEAMICACLASVSDMAIIPMADWLGLGEEAHLNSPGKLGGNWSWRAADGFDTAALAKRILAECAVYCRT